MPLTPHRGKGAAFAQAAQQADPNNSPIGILRKEPGLAAQFGYDPNEIEAKWQMGLAQQKAAGLGPQAPSTRQTTSLGPNIPAMRQQLLSRAQY
jgi:hypothetical protein